MNLGIFEFNDQSLLIQAEGRALYSEPGFARVNADAIETGQKARDSAWHEPQHNYNQYWTQLNQVPLAANEKWARHHADLAFAQLNALWREAGSPDSLLLLVPGSFSDAQLSLLLGLVKALPATTLAVLDSALAACLNCQRVTLYVDLQMHKSVLSVLTPGPEGTRISNQEVIPDLGMMQVLNSVARHISELLIDSARYDPMHTSAGEQAIFDQLPGWLLRLQWEDEISASVATDSGELPFILRKDVIKQLMRTRLLNMQSVVSRFPQARTVLSHESGLLTGLSDLFSEADIAPKGAGILASMDHLPQILEQVRDIYRVQSLNLGNSAGKPDEPVSRPATHLLHQHQALPLRQPVSIRINGGDVQLSGSMDPDASLTLVLRSGRLEVLHASDGMVISLPERCIAGETITIDGHRTRLIEVQGG